jgi:hypothetical protein
MHYYKDLFDMNKEIVENRVSTKNLVRFSSPTEMRYDFPETDSSDSKDFGFCRNLEFSNNIPQPENYNKSKPLFLRKESQDS